MAPTNFPLAGIDPLIWGILLQILLAFLACRLLYGWLKATGRQSARFSPTVASILTTPLLLVAWYALFMSDVVHFSILHAFIRGAVLLAVSSPIVIPLATLLAIYLLGGLQGRRIFGVILSATSVAVVMLQVCGLWYLADTLK